MNSCCRACTGGTSPLFFRCPVERNPGNCDIALVGVPHSTGNGTTERDQHLGPRAVRDVSAMARRVHMEFGDRFRGSARASATWGDVPLPEANDNEACIEAHHRVLPRDRRGWSAAGLGRRGPLRHRRDHAGDRRRGGAPDRREKGGVPALRCPYRRLRADPALSRSGEIRGPLGELSRAGWLHRCRATACRSACGATRARSIGASRARSSATR